MNSEKVKEILEIFANDNEPDGTTRICREALDLINELESENDTLHTNLCEWRKENQQLKDRIALLEKENESLKKQLIAIDTLDETNFEKRHNAIVFITKEQLKQFAEMLKDKADGLCIKNDILYAIKSSDIDETLKEFIEND